MLRGLILSVAILLVASGCAEGATGSVVAELDRSGALDRASEDADVEESLADFSEFFMSLDGWDASRDEFARVVRSLPSPTHAGRESVDVPERIGTYDITSAFRWGEAVIFYEATGWLFDDAGFAYLPNGPFDELEDGNFEDPQFTHLEGPWYWFVASW